MSHWDEMHKQFIIGNTTGITVETNFQRNEDGNVDVETGKYDDNHRQQLKVKYTHEIQLCLGVASVGYSDGIRVRKILKPFNYSGKKSFQLKIWSSKYN